MPMFGIHVIGLLMYLLVLLMYLLVLGAALAVSGFIVGYFFRKGWDRAAQSGKPPSSG